MNRILLGILVVLALWAGIATVAVRYQQAKNAKIVAQLQQSEEALKRAVAARKRSEAALVSSRRKNAASDRAAALAQASLSKSLAASPDWAATPVPDAVKQALKAPL